MNLDNAKLVLNDCTREELRDHAFGDVEVFWFKDGKEIATGYFGGVHAGVTLTPMTSFHDDKARELRNCGTLGQVDRNDETGPDEFTEGQIMPGLTKEGVRREITGG